MCKKNNEWVYNLIYDIIQAGVDEKQAIDMVLEWEKTLDKIIEKEHQRRVEYIRTVALEYIENAKSRIINEYKGVSEMGNTVFFRGYDCPACKTRLPVEVHYKNMKMVRVCCPRCGKWVYINRQQVLPDKY